MATSRSPTDFSVRVDHLNGVVRLHAAGELDLATAPVLEGALAAIEELQPSTIILDFQDLTFIASTGLHALVRAHARATDSGRLLAVVNGSAGVRRVLSLTATNHLFDPAILPDAVVASGQGRWSPLTFAGADGG